MTKHHLEDNTNQPIDPRQAVNDILAILNRRWTLRIIQELQHDRLTFRDLQAACDGMSPTVLNTRLKELRAANIISHDSGYGLTPRGKTLLIALKPLHDWALGEVMQWPAAGQTDDQEF